jgi:hypothetical protein
VLDKCGHRINSGNQDMRHTTAAGDGTPRNSSEMVRQGGRKFTLLFSPKISILTCIMREGNRR